MSILVYKSAGGTLPSGREIVRALEPIFARQDASSERRFSRYDKDTAKVLETSLLKLYMKEAKAQFKLGKLTRGIDERKLVATVAAIAKARAQLLAHEINNTTEDWVAEGREGVFSKARLTQIGLTEGSRASHELQYALARESGKATKRKAKVKWILSSKPCDDCKSVGGKTVDLGTEFVSRPRGYRALHAPLHPHCFCRTEIILG